LRVVASGSPGSLALPLRCTAAYTDLATRHEAPCDAKGSQHFRGYTKNRCTKNPIIRMVDIKKVETKANLADGFTKPLTGSAFAIFASLVTKVI
jgi:hypothetical protein